MMSQNTSALVSSQGKFIGIHLFSLQIPSFYLFFLFSSVSFGASGVPLTMMNFFNIDIQHLQVSFGVQLDWRTGYISITTEVYDKANLE